MTSSNVFAREEIELKLKDIFKELYKVEVDTDIRVEDVPSWDSLTHIKLIMKIESTYGMRIKANGVAEMYSSFERISNYIYTNQKGKS